MKKGMLSLLAKAKLIELSDDEKQELSSTQNFNEVFDIDQPSQKPTNLSDVQNHSNNNDINNLNQNTEVVFDTIQGRELDEIFAEAGLNTSPYPAEKLLKLLTGLQSMDMNTRKTVVKAMDDADDSWVLTDPINDAINKIKFIKDYQESIKKNTIELVNNINTNKELIINKLHEDTEEIKKQIASLQEMLERNISSTTIKINELENEIKNHEANSLSHINKLNEEIEKYQTIVTMFHNN